MTDNVSIDMSSFRKFASDLRKAEPLLLKELNTRMKLAGEIVASDARSRAGFSTRIPGSIKVGVSAARGVRVYARQAQAPDARPLEHGGIPGVFRHPVFGNRQNWVDQPAHPFLHPALEAGKPAALLEADKAVQAAFNEVKSHGF